MYEGLSQGFMGSYHKHTMCYWLHWIWQDTVSLSGFSWKKSSGMLTLSYDTCVIFRESYKNVDGKVKE